MPKPICQIYHSKTENTFLIESLAVDKEYGWTASYGPLLCISAVEMQEEGLDLVLQDLSQFHDRLKVGRSELEDLPEPEQAEFARSWQVITVCLENADMLRMTPMHTCEGGHTGYPEEEKRLNLPIAKQTFWECLLATFEKCG